MVASSNFIRWSADKKLPKSRETRKIGFIPENYYTRYAKQVYYSQPSKKPPDNAGTFQALDLYLVMCRINGVFRQYSWKSIEGVPPFNDF